MNSDVLKIQQQFESQLQKCRTLSDIESLEQEFFSRKNGAFTHLMKGLKDMDEAGRREAGQLLNSKKAEMEVLLNARKQELEHVVLEGIAEDEKIDVTQVFSSVESQGHLHPITQLEHTIEDFFTSLGFVIADGPELESEYYNFESVNIPATHPAREMQDTFFIKGHPGWVMRTHTSSVQVRAMQKFGAPLRMIAPGKCFRNEATDVRHEHTFYQVEGMVVDKGINFSHLKGIVEMFAKFLYGENTEVRFRPKYYPFVEPGVNGEVTCYVCKGAGCRLCKKTGWLEIFGAGMIHPYVLEEGGVDSKEYQGFAFGFGLNRLVMLKYNIEDIRLFQSGDMRFLNQF